jgi:ABC-type lipoprotein release transport system permease subunit
VPPFVLLIVAMAPRTAQRSPGEIALRAALGASRGRIVRQLLTEGLVLSLLGATAALCLARAGADLIRTSLPFDMVRWIVGWSAIRIDARTFAFTMALTLVTTLVFGLAPALSAARTDLVHTLKSGGRGSSGPPRRRVRGALVAIQLTLAVVL